MALAANPLGHSIDQEPPSPDGDQGRALLLLFHHIEPAKLPVST